VFASFRACARKEWKAQEIREDGRGVCRIGDLKRASRESAVGVVMTATPGARSWAILRKKLMGLSRCSITSMAKQMTQLLFRMRTPLRVSLRCYKCAQTASGSGRNHRSFGTRSYRATNSGNNSLSYPLSRLEPPNTNRVDTLPSSRSSRNSQDLCQASLTGISPQTLTLGCREGIPLCYRRRPTKTVL
jgi:hypothetical protein